MDPGTILASVTITLKAAKKAIEYLASVKNAPEEKTSIATEVRALGGLLDTLDIRLRNSRPNDQWYTALRSLLIDNGTLEDLKDRLDSLSAKSDLSTEASRKVLRRLKWHLDKDDCKEILKKIGQAKLNILLALHGDQFTLNLAIHGDVARVHEGVSAMSTDVKTTNDRLERQVMKSKIEAFLVWLEAPQVEHNHQHARDRHYGTTGKWLLDRVDFITWLHEAGKLLWISGIPGAGKSILASTVIDHIQEKHKGTGLFPILYFYFDYKVRSKQSYTGMLRSLIVQCYGYMNHLPECILERYESCRKTNSPPSQKDLSQILAELLQRLEEVYIVLDGLDESLDQREVIRWAQHQTKAVGLQVHLMIFSRKEAVIERNLEPCVWSHISLNDTKEKVDSDIGEFITYELEEDDDLSRWSTSEKDLMRTTLIDNAHGMFQWVRCQLDALKGCLSPEELEETLADLPGTLDGTYERILQKISPQHASKASAILQWLCVAERSLGLTEVADLLAVDLGTSAYSIKRRLRDPRDVLQICGCLIRTFPRSSSERDAVLEDELVHFSHRSVQEYLVGGRIQQSNCSSFSIDQSLAHQMMAEVCIVYLYQFDHFEYIDHPPRWSGEWSIKRPALKYCAQFWGAHLIQGSPKALVEKPLRLFRSEAIFRTMVSICPMYQAKALPPKLHYAACQRAYYVCQSLLKEGSDVDACMEKVGTALQVATREDEDIVRLLLDHKANPDIACDGTEPWNTLPLVTNAVRPQTTRSMSLAHMLLDAGARRYLQMPFCLSPMTGDLTLLEKYLQCGVKANDCSEDGLGTNSALKYAIVIGREDMVRLLIDNGADVNRASCPIYWATEFMQSLGYCNPQIARMCFEAGGDVSPLLCHVSSCGWVLKPPQDSPLFEDNHDHANDEDAIAIVGIMMEALRDDLDSHIILWKLLSGLAEGSRKRNTEWQYDYDNRPYYNRSAEKMLQEHVWKNFQELVKLHSEPEAVIEAVMKKWDKLEGTEHGCRYGTECLSLRRERWARLMQRH